MELRLIRIAYLPEATLGRLAVGALNLFTLEEPWVPNPYGPGGARRSDGQESCVPDGEYQLTPHDGTLFRDVYRLSNPMLGVFDYESEMPAAKWGRSAVLIHSGNTTDDILGCILVGLAHGRLHDKAAVLSSRAAVAELRKVLQRDEHTLTIEPTRGTA
jgi:hypothetical protein